uniref:peptide methionine sulfoxide reductase MsrB-like n=1 Tax=Styela clava TaxID=7725 RepID=UPI0019396718|nr:peptide methionine sulfoxide reductase MsrB-like [Styela clava]
MRTIVHRLRNYLFFRCDSAFHNNSSALSHRYLAFSMYSRTALTALSLVSRGSLRLTKSRFTKIVTEGHNLVRKSPYRPITMGSLISGNSPTSSSGVEVKFTEEELKERLTPMQYHVTQEKGTERAFTGELIYNKESGIYSCVVCGQSLFKSDHKFDSGSGWPSFHEVMNSDSVDTHTDLSHGMKRVEVTCKKCGSHLGHLFDDGPKPSGQRFCINSASLKFDGSKKKSEL